MSNKQQYVPGRDVQAMLNGAAIGRQFPPFGSDDDGFDPAQGWVEDDGEPIGQPPRPKMRGPIKTMDKAAYHGVLGKIALEIGDYIEADTSALLVTLLTLSGIAIGRNPHLQTGPHTHYAVINTVVVGKTGGNKSDHIQPLFCLGQEAREIERKALAANPALVVVTPLFPRVLSGLSTGEGLYHQIRDKVEALRTGDDGVEHLETVDRGVDDKRLLVIESELARLLGVMAREGNTLSSNIRELYDCKEVVQSSPKNGAITVTGPFVGIIGLITPEELSHRMKESELYNGFGNRWLFPLAWRAHSRPFPPDYTLKAAEHARAWYAAVERARGIGRMTYSVAARNRWERDYENLRQGWLNGQQGRRGMAEEVGARAHSMVMRIALVFAAMDGETAISTAHQNAAFAVWDFCERSITKLFAGLTGDPVKDTISEQLRAKKKMTRAELGKLFHCHVKAAVITAALKELEQAKLVRVVTSKTAGRAVEVWEWIGR